MTLVSSCCYTMHESKVSCIRMPLPGRIITRARTVGPLCTTISCPHPLAQQQVKPCLSTPETPHVLSCVMCKLCTHLPALAQARMAAVRSASLPSTPRDRMSDKTYTHTHTETEGQSGREASSAVGPRRGSAPGRSRASE